MPARVTLPLAAVDPAGADAVAAADAAAEMIAVVVPSPESVVCVLLALDAVERFLFRAAVAAATGLIASSDEPVWHSVSGIELAIWTLQRDREKERERE